MCLKKLVSRIRLHAREAKPKPSNLPNESKLSSKRDNSLTVNINQVKSSKETKGGGNTAHEVKSQGTDPLSSIIQMNSTHVNGKLLEPVDIMWDRNIYFSVKTTAKYFKERLSALIPTWFQVVNKKMVSSESVFCLIVYCEMCTFVF